MKIVALAGGVGGAKLAYGLASELQPGDLTVIVNTADDFQHLGLHISPDLDTVCYTLAGMANPATGWGRRNESWNFMAALGRLGGPGWFRIGDADLATHVERTRRIGRGDPLSTIVREFCHSWGVQHSVLPMTDSAVATIVQSHEGDLDFQEYFVHRKCEPKVRGFKFLGIESARPAPGVADALADADAIVICPSNPLVSIAPILGIPGVRNLVARGWAVAVSPIVGGRAIRGPAAKMYAELGIEPSALSIAVQYRDIARGLVIDRSDASLQSEVVGIGLRVLVTQTLMRTLRDRRRLARDVLDFIRAELG